VFGAVAEPAEDSTQERGNNKHTSVVCEKGKGRKALDLSKHSYTDLPLQKEGYGARLTHFSLIGR
jgi:hypothetical protein